MLRKYTSSRIGRESLANVLGSINAGLLFDVEESRSKVHKKKAMDGRTVFVTNYTGTEVWLVYMDELDATNEREAEWKASSLFVKERLEKIELNYIAYRQQNVTPDGERYDVAESALLTLDWEEIREVYELDNEPDYPLL